MLVGGRSQVANYVNIRIVFYGQVRLYLDLSAFVGCRFSASRQDLAQWRGRDAPAQITVFAGIVSACPLEAIVKPSLSTC